MMWILLLCLYSMSIAVNGMPYHHSQHIVEVYGVVEPQVVRNYMKVGYSKAQAKANIRGDIEFFINEINRYYESMRSSNLFIEVRLKKWQFSKEIFQKSDISKDLVLDAYGGLDTFKKWLADNKAFDKYSHDVAILWTGYDISGHGARPTSTSGLATTASVCYPHKAAGIVEFDGTQHTASTTAHELAHTLGSGHDKVAECAPFMGYLMTPIVSAMNEKRWGFSPCTIRKIKRNIAKLDKRNNNCLLKTTTVRPSFHPAKHYGRDLLNVAKLCQRGTKDITGFFNGGNNYYEGQPPKGDKLCQCLKCKSNSNQVGVVPTESLMCDIGKRCNRGKCVPAPTPNDVVPDCMFGDLLTTKSSKARGYCEKQIGKKGLGTCYTYATWKDCCGTCTSKRLDIQDCEFGDRYQKCSRYTPDEICPYFKKQCCETCRNFRGKRSEVNETVVEPPFFEDDDEDIYEDNGDLDDDVGIYDDDDDDDDDDNDDDHLEDEDDDNEDDIEEEDEDGYSDEEHFDDSETERD